MQDAPDQPGAVRVELGTGETPDWSVLYVYEARGRLAVWSSPYEWICRETMPSGHLVTAGARRPRSPRWRSFQKEVTVDEEKNSPAGGEIDIRIAGAFYLIGYKTAYDRIENAAPPAVTAMAEFPKGGNC